MKVYADNAATTKMSRSAIDAMLPYMEEVFGNPSSLYTIGQEAAEAVYKAREKFAKALGCTVNEIYFTSGGSEADNQAIRSAAEIGAKRNKKHIISTTFEHHAVLHTLDKLQTEGFDITYLDVHENGLVTAEQVAEAIRPDTCLVTIMYANNEIGTVQPIREIGALCREKKITFHTDAVQAIGHIPVNVKEDNIDMLSLSAHKFHGPKGVGVLYVRKGVYISNLIQGGAQERGKRGGTENVPGIMGAAAAIEEAVKNLGENSAKLLKLRERLIDGLLEIPHSVLNGDRNSRLQVLVRHGLNIPGFWLCIDPQSWVVTAKAEDVYTGALGDGRLYAHRNGKLVSYPLRDAAMLKAWAEEVLEDTVQEGD